MWQCSQLTQKCCVLIWCDSVHSWHRNASTSEIFGQGMFHAASIMFLMSSFPWIQSGIFYAMKSVGFWVITRRHVVNNYHTTPCNYPEDHRFHQHRGGSLKSRLFYASFWCRAKFCAHRIIKFTEIQIKETVTTCSTEPTHHHLLDCPHTNSLHLSLSFVQMHQQSFGTAWLYSWDH